MIGIIASLFGKKNKVDYKSLVENGALILDVRTTGEFHNGHIKKSLNIPLQSIMGSLNKIPKDKTVITCCASGVRSAQAKRILESSGYTNVYNGGGWQSLNSRLF